MSLPTIRRAAVVTTEIVALIAAALVGNVAGPTSSAIASPEQPVVAFTIPAPTGITIDSPWVTDATGAIAVALGVDGSGMGVLVRRNLTTLEITTTPTVVGEVGAWEGRLVPTSGNIVFLVKRLGTGSRVVMINPTTGTRVWSYDLAATDTAPRGISMNSAGTFIYVGSNPGSSLALKLSSTTGALSSSVASPASPFTAGGNYSGKFVAFTGTPGPRLVIFKDVASFGVDTSTALTGISVPLVDVQVVGNIAWMGTSATPGRLVGVDLSGRSVSYNYPLSSTEAGLRNITVPTGSTFAYGTTTNNGHTHLLTIRLSDGARLGDTDLGAITGATAVTVFGNYVDVAFSGSTAIVRTTTATAPSAPSGVTVTDADRTLVITWGASSSTEPLVTYRVHIDGGSPNCVTNETTCTITGLTNGMSYSVTVTAESYAGSTTSVPVAGTPATVPEPPANLVLARGNSMVTATWSPTSDGGRPISEYELMVEPGQHVCRTVATTCTIAGLVNGQQYTAHIIARTVWGDSAPAITANPVRPASHPDQPTAPTAVRANRSVTLSWIAPYDQGEPISEYLVELDGAEVCRTRSVSCIVDGLANGAPVSFTVRAMNALGSSVHSAESSAVTPATIPSAPNLLEVHRGNSSLDVSWGPADDGGEPITEYRVTTDPLSAGCVTSELSCSLAGLTNGQRYDISVVAVNLLGHSESSAIGAGTPATVPSAPSISSVNDEIGASTVSWEPGSTGGDPIAFYRVILWREAESVREWITSDLSLYISGIANPDVYRVTVEAENTVGTSVRATGSVTPLAPPPPPVVEPPVIQPPVVEPPVVPQATIPLSPTSVTMVSMSKSQWVLTWPAPATGGSAIKDYRIARGLSSSKMTVLRDGVTSRRTVRIARPSGGRAAFVRIVSVNAIGASNPPLVVKVQGRQVTVVSSVYAMPSVFAVRFNEAAALAGSFARSTPYDGTNFVSVGAHSDFL